MARIPTLSLIFVLTAVLSVELHHASVAFAQKQKQGSNKNGKNNQNSQKNKATESLKQAREKLATSSQSLKNAVQQLAGARTKLQAATLARNQVRQGLEEGLESNPKLKQAAAALEKAKTAFEQVSQPVIDRARTTPEYQTAVENRDRASQELKELRDLVGVDQEKVRRLAARVAELTAEPRRLEAEAIDSHSPARRAREKMLAEGKSHGKLRGDLKDRLKDDKKLKSATAEATSARNQVEKAEKSVLTKQRAFALAQQAVVKAQSQLSKANQQSKSNKNNKNNNKKKKK